MDSNLPRLQLELYKEIKKVKYCDSVVSHSVMQHCFPKSLVTQVWYVLQLALMLKCLDVSFKHKSVTVVVMRAAVLGFVSR